MPAEYWRELGPRPQLRFANTKHSVGSARQSVPRLATTQAIENSKHANIITYLPKGSHSFGAHRGDNAMPGAIVEQSPARGWVQGLVHHPALDHVKRRRHERPGEPRSQRRGKVPDEGRLRKYVRCERCARGRHGVRVESLAMRNTDEGAT